MLDEIISDAAAGGAREVVIGMAHRGRLNVLTHILGKPYAAIIAAFEGEASPAARRRPTPPSTTACTGDVKYHLGARLGAERGRRHGRGADGAGAEPEPPRIRQPGRRGDGRAPRRTSATSRARRDTTATASLAILLHGDAAFPGQGVVAETLNLSGLPGYSTGGTIHIIVNNQIGFTTDIRDSRSTLYAGDLAKGFEIPVVHVNADDPEACLIAARMAMAYRQRFGKDFLIDLVGYRRWGHNEGDEPVFTQPRMYARIGKHPTVRQRLRRRAGRRGRRHRRRSGGDAARRRSTGWPPRGGRSSTAASAAAGGDENGRYDLRAEVETAVPEERCAPTMRRSTRCRTGSR